MTPVRSLFILSLPCSLSSLVHAIVAEQPSLRSPTWVSQGEILSVDRLALYRGNVPDQTVRYLREEENAKAFGQMHDYLTDVTHVEGFIYRDVGNPFVMAAWSGLRRVNVLKIHRDVVDVAYLMLQRESYYPYFGDPRRTAGAPAPALGREMEEAVIRGLLHAQCALSAIPGTVVDFAEMIRSESSLTDALKHLYPDAAIPIHPYIDDAWKRRRDQMLHQYTTPRYAEIRELVARCIHGAPQARPL